MDSKGHRNQQVAYHLKRPRGKVCLIYKNGLKGEKHVWPHCFYNKPYIQLVYIISTLQSILCLFVLSLNSKGICVYTLWSTQTLVPGECGVCTEFLKSNAPHWFFCPDMFSWLLLCRSSNLFSLHKNNYLVQLVK